MDKFYGGGGKFGVQYEVVIEYEDKQFILNNIANESYFNLGLSIFFFIYM